MQWKVDTMKYVVRLFFEYVANLDLRIRDKDGNIIFEHAIYWKDFNIMKMMAFHQNTL